MQKLKSFGQSVVNIIILLALTLLGGAAVYGYVHNIYNVAVSEPSFLAVCRAVGIIVAPLGAILGFF